MRKRYRTTGVQGLTAKMSKGLCTLLAGALLAGASLGPVNKAEAMQLPCKECCPSSIMNMMTDMGLMAYEMADFMNGMCQMMPFFGMFCPDLDQMAGNFFSQVLRDPQLTMDMLACADGNDAMLAWMLKVMHENPELLHQMGTYMGMTGDGNSAGCHLTEQFTDMALRHDNLKSFFFAKINDHLYQNLTKSMLCNTDTAVNIGELMAANAQEQMQPGTPFVNAFMNMGAADNDNDGNELANERMFYAIFSNIDSANDFLDGLQSLGGDSPELVGAFMDFIFLGKQQVPATTCQPWQTQGRWVYVNGEWVYQPGCVEQPASELIHGNQAIYNQYAIMEAFVTGVAPYYVMDPDHPPVPDSSVPANALFGRFMSMLIDAEGNMTPYAQSFFSTMATGAQVHCWQPAQQFMAMMMGLMEMGQVPFTAEQFSQMMPQLINPQAPAPRNFKDDSGEALEQGECATEPPPAAQCGENSLAACSSEDDCLAMNGFWYEEGCHGEALPGCDEQHLDLCADEDECSSAGGFWYDSACNSSAQPSCDGANLDLCSDESSCSLAGGFWVGGECQADEPLSCDAEHLDLCEAEQECTNAGGFWYDQLCNSEEQSAEQTISKSATLRRYQQVEYGPFAAASFFKVDMTGSGDADLYVKRGSRPSWRSYDCSPYTSNSNESCSLSGAGKYYIMVEGYARSSSITVKVQFDQ